MAIAVVSVAVVLPSLLTPGLYLTIKPLILLVGAVDYIPWRMLASASCAASTDMNWDMTIPWVLLVPFALAGYLWLRQQVHVLDRKLGEE